MVQHDGGSGGHHGPIVWRWNYQCNCKSPEKYDYREGIRKHLFHLKAKNNAFMF